MKLLQVICNVTAVAFTGPPFEMSLVSIVSACAAYEAQTATQCERSRGKRLCMTLFGLRKVPSCRTQKVLGKRRSGGCHPAMDHIRPSRQDTAPYTRAGHACLRRSSTGRNQNAKVRRSQLGVATPPHQFASCGCRSRSSAAVSRQSTNKQARSNLATVGRAERSARLASPAVTMSTTDGAVAIAACCCSPPLGCRPREVRRPLRKRRAARQLRALAAWSPAPSSGARARASVRAVRGQPPPLSPRGSACVHLLALSTPVLLVAH